MVGRRLTDRMFFDSTEKTLRPSGAGTGAGYGQDENVLAWPPGFV